MRYVVDGIYSVLLLACGLTDVLAVRSGLTYTPGMYASTSELAQLCKALAEEFPGAFYAPHHRSYGFRAIESYGEMLELGSQTGCPIRKSSKGLAWARWRLQGC